MIQRKREREKKRKKEGFFEKFFEKKFFKILENSTKHRLFQKTVNFRKILFMCKFNHLFLYFFVYLISPRCKGQEVANREKLHGMHDVRLLFVFPFVSRIPDTWPTLSRRNSRNTRSRSHLLVSESSICVRRPDESPAPSYDAAKILPIRRDRQSKKKNAVEATANK